MGCASSQPAVDHATSPGKTSTPSQGAPNGPPPQPLYAGGEPRAAAGAATKSEPSVPSTREAPVVQENIEAPPQPVQQAAPAAVPAAPAAAVAAAASTDAAPDDSRRGNADEASDWDQCSTGHFEPETVQQHEVDLPSPGNVLQNAQSSFLGAPEDTTEDYTGPYRETTTLKIDKVKGCMFVNQYLVVKYLGRGACGKVFLCLNTNDLRLYAMKAVRKVDLEASQQQQGPPAPGAKPRRNPMDDLRREIQIMRQMKHNNIVMLSEVIDDPAGSKLLLVMEFMEGGPVLTREALEKREKLPESLALAYFRDMIKALDYLHSHKVVHGDLKPENVLMAANGEVKLSDFGCSKIFATGNEYLERCNGTPAFLAPEMMKPNTRYRGRPTDVYALGACLYTLVFGRIPFSAPNLYKLFQVVQNEPVRYPEDTPVSDALRHMLGAMLTKNPRERISLPQLMTHPWVTMFGQFPLKSTDELGPGETQEFHDKLPNNMTYAECHPALDYLTGLAVASGYERSFKEGDILMRQGDTGTYLLYIVNGTVDVLVKWVQPPPSSGRRNSTTTNNGGAEGSAPGQQPSNGSRQRSNPDEFMDESDSLSPILNMEGYTHRANLARAAAKASEFVGSLQSAGGGRDLLVAQRGPGELVGDMALFSRSLTRCATVRCATRVTARVITHEQLVEYLAAQPLAKHQIREGIWKKESEIIMVEALVGGAGVKLANVADLVMSTLQTASGSLGSHPGHHI
ncbi:hypothetical protein QJQ45_027611 [Haematococcus lacustris]|nr:hypothetical protein QJQ45_027611 [Haematococcus lacustris]